MPLSKGWKRGGDVSPIVELKFARSVVMTTPRASLSTPIVVGDGPETNRKLIPGFIIDRFPD